jgi:hypothetical protein
MTCPIPSADMKEENKRIQGTASAEKRNIVLFEAKSR